MMRRWFALGAGAAALALLSCVCTSVLPGANATATPAPGQAQATLPAGPTGEPSGGETPVATEEAAATLAPAPPAASTIPPTASVGEDHHEVKQGQIDSPGQTVTYTFDAAPGQEFYFGVVEVDSGVALVHYQLTDQDGAQVFEACLGCGDPGAYVLTRGGTYTLSIGGADSGTGAFQIVIASVRVHYFATNLGDPIGPGQPGPGAGSIETPGGRDMYTFNGEAGQEVYFGVSQVDSVSLVRWRLVAPDNTDVFASCLGCGNPGPYVLPATGVYTMIAGSGPGLQTGTYTLVVNLVHTDKFDYTIGSPIADGQPGLGAGNIESPGARDVYTFTATPGQQVTFNVVDGNNVPLVHLQLVDETGAEIFSTCVGCGNPGSFTLEHGGAYTLTIGGGTDLATGTYELDIH